MHSSNGPNQQETEPVLENGEERTTQEKVAKVKQGGGVAVISLKKSPSPAASNEVRETLFS